ncbi:hypothetical protein HZS_2801 [Henneguya salminicola]|nr:hypothetical protein HZS_2801 [Henneguya salminicola]
MAESLRTNCIKLKISDRLSCFPSFNYIFLIDYLPETLICNSKTKFQGCSVVLGLLPERRKRQDNPMRVKSQILNITLNLLPLEMPRHTSDPLSIGSASTICDSFTRFRMLFNR